MGGSFWFCATDFTTDLAEALRAAKHRVFTDGDFVDPYGLVADPAGARQRLSHVNVPPAWRHEHVHDVAAARAKHVAPQLAAIDDYLAAPDLDSRLDALRRAPMPPSSRSPRSRPAAKPPGSSRTTTTAHRGSASPASLATDRAPPHVTNCLRRTREGDSVLACGCTFSAMAT